MSSILKALEKVEEAQSGRRSGAAGGFIKQRQRRAAWVLPVGVLSGAIVAAMATFAAMGGFSRHHADAPKAAAVAKAEAVVAPAAVPAAAPAVPVQQTVAVPMQQSVAVPAPAAAAPAKAKAAAAPQPKQHVHVAVKGAAVPVKQATPAKKVAAAHPAKPASVSAVKAARPVAAKAKPANARQGKAVASANEKRHHKAEKGETIERQAAKAEQRKVARAERPVQARAQALPALVVPAKAVAPQAAPPAPVVASHAPEKSRPKVTGIAWQNDSASSVAMVNGRSVQQGATVDGYKVEQIFEDKVRFSSSGGKVEVPLGAGQ